MQTSINSHLRRLAALLLLCVLSFTAYAQTASIESLRQLRNQLIAQEGLRNADATVVIHENALSSIANQLTGLEIKLSNGTVLRLSSIALQLHAAAAFVQIGVKVLPPAPLPTPVSLLLNGRLGSGEIVGTKLRIPFQLTEVKSDSLPSSLLTAIFRSWLAPERWNAVLPSLEIPLNLSETFEIPAAHFDVEGTMPTEITTPAYQVKLNFTLAALLMLEGRAVVALNLQTENAPSTVKSTDQQTAPSSTVVHNTDSESGDAAALEQEITKLSEHLNTESGLRLRLRRAAINSLLTPIAAARETDLSARLKPARIRDEQKDTLIRVHNYADVESGDGRADIQQLTLESISDHRLHLRLTAQGELTAKLRGREYGIPYALSPHGTFAISNEPLPLEVITESGRLILRAVPGSQLPVRVSLKFEVMGRSLSLPQTISVQADRWLNKLVLPEPLSREVQVPHKIEAGNGTGMKIVSSEMNRYTLANLKVKAEGDAIDITFNQDIPH